jgi:hypothetical protein
MPEENGAANCAPSRSFRVTPLPMALYVSGDLIFELYNGGQPYRPMVIRWERLKAKLPTTEQLHEHKHEQ